MARRKLIAGNWKMNGLKAESDILVNGLLDHIGAVALPADLLICPPVTLLERVGHKIAGSPILLGAQDCHPAQSGAYTGDISAAMIKDMGATHVIVGHSERREAHGETDLLIKIKAEAALDAGLVVIVCVGESEAVHLSGATSTTVGAQLLSSIPGGASADNLIVAYEPIWAIGTGHTPTLDEVQEVHAGLRARLRSQLGRQADAMRILYGGSMKPSNAKDLLALPDVDGGLVGGCSLKAEDFWAIAMAA